MNLRTHSTSQLITQPTKKSGKKEFILHSERSEFMSSADRLLRRRPPIVLETANVSASSFVFVLDDEVDCDLDDAFE